MKTIQFRPKFLLILAIGLTLTSCVEDDDFDIPDINVTDPEIDGDIVTIGSVLGIIAQNDGDNFTIESNIYVEGYVISSDEGGNFFEELIIQDKPSNPTAGIRISVNVNPLFTKYNFGRKIYVKLQGLTAGITNGVGAIGTVDGNRIGQIQESQAENVILRTSETAPIEPLPVSVSDFSQDLENLYIQLDNMQFPTSSVLVDDPLTFAAEPTDEFDGERVIKSCNTGNTTIVSTSTFADFRFLTLPTQAGSLRGVLSRDFFDEKYVFVLNSPETINFDQDRCILGCGTLETPASNDFINVDFEDQATNQPVNLPGWTNYIEAGTETWETYTQDGSNASLGVSARVGSYLSNNESSIAWLITPIIPVTSNQIVSLEFKTSNSFSDDSDMQLLFSLDWDGTEENIEFANWIELSEAIIAKDDTYFGDWISSGILDLSCFENDIYIAFKYIGSGDENQDGTYELDEIFINVE